MKVAFFVIKKLKLLNSKLDLEHDLSFLGSGGSEGLLLLGELLGASGSSLALGALVNGVAIDLLLAGLNLGVVGIESNTDIAVLEGVALRREHSIDSLRGLDDGLDFIGVDDAGQVSVAHHGAWQGEPTLKLGGLIVGAEDRVKFLEGSFSPNAEATDVSSRSQVEKVQVVNQSKFYTGQVAERLVQALGDVVDHKGAASLHVAAISLLSRSSTDLA